MLWACTPECIFWNLYTQKSGDFVFLHFFSFIYWPEPKILCYKESATVLISLWTIFISCQSLTLCVCLCVHNVTIFIVERACSCLLAISHCFDLSTQRFIPVIQNMHILVSISRVFLSYTHINTYIQSFPNQQQQKTTQNNLP